jgi:hypothetical protein
MRYATFNSAQPDTTNESLPLGSLSCLRHKQGMLGCWMLRIGSLRSWRGMESLSTSKRPMPTSRSIGRAYRIEGDAFVFVDRKTRGTRAILG